MALYMYPNCFIINTHKNIVTTANAEENTTSCAANSPSPSICCAIVNDDTAVGAASIIINVASSTFLNPSIIAIGIHIPGTSISLPPTPIIIYLRFPFISLNLNYPPNINKAKGVATFDISEMLLSIA